MTNREKDWLVALQRGIPLVPRPFEALACELNCDESELIAFVERCRSEGLVRRFGAVFDTRRLGYRSALCAVAVPRDKLDESAAQVTPLKGVTHCYAREVPSGTETLPNLWFTLSEPADVFDAMADEIAVRVKPYTVRFLPATRRYKIDVVFGAATRACDESVADGAPVTARDRAVIRVTQGDTHVCPDFFTKLAAQAEIPEWDLLSSLEMWKRNGRLKRIGLLLAHRTAGYIANGMCCWHVDGDTTDAGRALAACGEVSHCYERPVAPDFPYNLFAMVHTKSPAEAQAAFEHLESTCGLHGGVMLLSTKEYKKTSMTFFAGS